MVHLSQRAQAITESPTLAISAKAKALRLEGLDVVSFGAGEPDFDTPTSIKQDAHDAIQEGFTKYTPVGGILPLKQAIQKMYERSHGLSYSPAEIMVSCGAKHSLYNVFQAICDPGDEVLIMAPYWVSYPHQVRLAGAVPVIVPSTSSFGIDLGQIRAAIGERTRAVLVNTPSNPTGQIYGDSELAGLAELVKKHDLFVISDEIYERLLYGDSEHRSIVAHHGLREQGVIVSGVSKTFAMTGWRIGYTMGPAEIIDAMNRIQSHSTSCPNGIAQRAALAALSADVDALLAPMIAEFDKRRLYMISRLKNMSGISVDEPRGAFYAFPNVSKFYGRPSSLGTIDGSGKFAQALLETHNVALVPGAAFGSDHHVRLSYATSLDDIEKGMDRLEEFLTTLR